MSDTTWVYRNSQPGLWTVGFFRPDGVWEPESDHSSAEKAAERVHYLNGGQVFPNGRTARQVFPSAWRQK
jgi:hypothetical protein